MAGRPTVWTAVRSTENGRDCHNSPPGRALKPPGGVRQTMAPHVLVALDGSAPAEHALDRALAEADGATVTAIHVVDPAAAVTVAELEGPVNGGTWFEDATERAEGILAEARETAEEYGVDLRTETAVGRPAREIVAYADDHDVDEIIVGSHGRRGIERAVLGSVAEHVVRRADCTVTVVR